MSTIPTATSRPFVEKTKNKQRNRMPFLAQVGMLAGRALLVNFRVPFVIVPPLLISLFTLVVYQAQLGGVGESFLKGESYLGFILPLAVVSAALSGSSVGGETLVKDIERGYFNKLLLTPANRWAILLGAMIAGGVVLAMQTTTIVITGLVLGLKPETGILGLIAIIALGLVLGVSFSGLSVGVALLTGNAAATGGSVFLFFPLTFLTSTFVPLDQLDGWIKVAAQLNPITYVLEAMRAILNKGWDANLIGQGLIAEVVFFVLLFSFALFGLRSRTRRR